MEYEEVEVNSERWFDLTPLLNEEFRDIKGYEGLYQVSNYGRVKSLTRNVKNNSVLREKILKNNIRKNKYCQVNLYKNTIYKKISIHRLVIGTFILNLENKPCVNHIDGNPTNNRLDNLEWCTYSENIQHSFKYLNRQCPTKGKFGKFSTNYREVNQYDLKGNFIKKWFGFHEINRKLGFDYRNVCACCRGKQQTAYGYIWRYTNE